MKSTLKKRKKGASLLENGANIGVQEMKEENIVDESKTAASSTLSKKKRINLGTHVKFMTLLSPSKMRTSEIR